MANSFTAGERLALALATLEPVMDVVEGRVEGPLAPGWCERRGWTDFLLSLSDAALAACESEGTLVHLERAPEAPPDLVELARAVKLSSMLPRTLNEADALPVRELAGVRSRKRAQLGALLPVLGAMAENAERIVDIGAGRGAFTRLAARRFERQAVGIERNEERVSTAAMHAARHSTPSGARPTFRASDVFKDGLELGSGDLAVGLHACGELGDALVRAAAKVRCDTALVSCCLQKISTTSRPSLSLVAAKLVLPRGILGLTNQTARSMGVEGDLGQMLSAREVRYALYSLLRARGVDLEAGAEMSGINRRRAREGLSGVAERALALRGLSPPTPAELAHHAQQAEADFRRVRRLSLPRGMLARLVEVTISLDRAAHLEEHGLHTVVATSFDQAASPRNIALFASRDPGRLPMVR